MAKAKSKPAPESAVRPLAGRPTIVLNSIQGSINYLNLQVVGLPEGDLSVELGGLFAASWSVGLIIPSRCPGTTFELVIFLNGTMELDSKFEHKIFASGDLTVTVTSTPNPDIDPPGPAVTVPEVDIPIHVININQP